MIVATSDIIIGPTGESFLCRLCGVVFFLLVEPTMMYLKMAELGLAQRAPFRTDSRAPPTGEQCQTTTTTLCTYAPRSTRLDISLKKNITTLKFDLDLPVAVF